MLIGLKQMQVHKTFKTSFTFTKAEGTDKSVYPWPYFMIGEDHTMHHREV